MTIDRLCLRDFLMFKGSKFDDFSKYRQDMVCEARASGLDEFEPEMPEDSFDESFIDGINILIGANATGKTSILKCTIMRRVSSAIKASQRIKPERYSTTFLHPDALLKRSTKKKTAARS